MKPAHIPAHIYHPNASLCRKVSSKVSSKCKITIYSSWSLISAVVIVSFSAPLSSSKLSMSASAVVSPTRFLLLSISWYAIHYSHRQCIDFLASGNVWAHYSIDQKQAAGSEHRQCAGETYRDTRQMFVFHASVNKCQTQDIRWSEMMVVLHLSVFHYSVSVYRQDCMYLLISTELFVYLCCRSRKK